MDEPSKKTVLERRVELLKMLQNHPMRTGELAEHFQVSERVIRKDLERLRDGLDVFGTRFTIETRHPGSAKQHFKSTLHPIVLGLNGTELLGLFQLLERASEDEFAGPFYQQLLTSIYSQTTPYMSDRVDRYLKRSYTKKQVVTTLEEQIEQESASATNLFYKFVHLMKHERELEYTLLEEGDDARPHYGFIRQIEGNRLLLHNKATGQQSWVVYHDLIINWAYSAHGSQY